MKASEEDDPLINGLLIPHTVHPVKMAENYLLPGFLTNDTNFNIPFGILHDFSALPLRAVSHHK